MMLKIENLTKSYGDLEVLKGINLEVTKGKVMVILGSSGCGKSTLLRCINALEIPNSGQVSLNGELITPANLISMRQKIGMVFQSYELFSHLNVLENITLAPLKVQKRPKDEVKAQALALLERVGLKDKQNAYARQLSGGQKQRVAIVRALAMRPEVMLFDEVTAALDPQMVREVLEVILELANSGLTMLIVTHELNFARAVADKIVFLDNGVVAECASAKEFFTKPKTKKAQEFLASFEFNPLKNI